MTTSEHGYTKKGHLLRLESQVSYYKTTETQGEYIKKVCQKQFVDTLATEKVTRFCRTCFVLKEAAMFYKSFRNMVQYKMLDMTSFPLCDRAAQGNKT